MAYSVQQIKFEIYRYIKEYDSDFNNWYIGISENPKKTINIDHNIDLENGIWLYKQALLLRLVEQSKNILSKI